MFRELARKKKEITRDECIDILKNEKRGVLSVLGDEGYPYGMPMNHFYDEEDGCIYFHSGKEGHRTDSLKKWDRVSFCVYDRGYIKEGDWALNIKSVIVFGKIEIIDDIEKIVAISRKLSYKFTSDDEYIDREIALFGAKTDLLRLRIEHMCGKAVEEK